MNKSRPPLLHLTFLILLLVGLGYLFYVTETKLRVVNRMSAEVNLLAENQSKLNDLAVNLPRLSKDVENWTRTLPGNEADVAMFATTIEEAARRENLVITIHFDDFPEEVDVSGLKVESLGTDVILEGSFLGLTNFTAELSRMPYFYKIDKLTILKHESKVGIKATLNGLLMMNTN